MFQLILIATGLEKAEHFNTVEEDIEQVILCPLSQRVASHSTTPLALARRRLLENFVEALLAGAA